MKKYIVIIPVIISILLIAACGKSNNYEIEITIPAGSQDAFVYSDEEISPTGNIITILSGEGLNDTEIILKPIEVQEENIYEPTYLTPGMPVKMEVEEGAWFKIGVAIQNTSDTNITVSIEVDGIEVRIRSDAEDLSDKSIIESYTKDENCLIKENPYRENYQEYEPFEKNGKITFMQRQMPITSAVEEFEELFFDEATEEEWDALNDYCDASDSRVGGYPFFVQYAPAYYDEGTCDILLLQLDVDDTCGIMFGDSGNCTFLISKEELKKRDFSRVEYDWQCC